MSAHATYFNEGSCVSSNTSNMCYWCSASGGETPARTCSKGYASCVNGATVLKEGEFANDSGYKCTVNGFVDAISYSTDINDMCLYTNKGNGYSDNCYWCVGDSSTPDRKCRKEYSLCTGETVLVTLGNYAGNTQYRCSSNGFRKCDNGFYETDGRCEQCPYLYNINGQTGGVGGKNITDCFIKGNIEIKDDTGTFIYTSDCYYKN